MCTSMLQLAINVYFFLLNTPMKTDKKGRNMYEVDHTLHIAVHNYSAVVCLCVCVCVYVCERERERESERERELE